jgi:hypothetical protein
VAEEVKENTEGNLLTSYVRVSATPTATPETVYEIYAGNNAYVLYDEVWINYSDYCSNMEIKEKYLTDFKPDKNGKYLIYFPAMAQSTYEADVAQAREDIKDYLYKYESVWSETAKKYQGKFTKSAEGSYVRLTGTESPNSGFVTVHYSYVNKGGETGWEDKNGYLKNFSLSNEGDYLVSISSCIPNLTLEYAMKDLSAYLYDVYGQKRNILGKALYLPELATPDWLSSSQAYQNTILGTTQSFQTWLYLLYANFITNNEKGGNEVVDKLLKVVHAKNESIKKVVDSMGEGTATLDPTFIKNLRLTEFIGEDSVIISKTEMQILSAALELCDATLNFLASYDLSADLKCGKDFVDEDFGRIKESLDYGYETLNKKIIKAVNDAVLAKTLSVRDATKLETSKEMFSNAFERIISCYDSIKDSTLYPQIVKDKIAEYGATYYDGFVKAKDAVDNGGVFYLPKEPNAKTFPTSEAEALFGIDCGKVFTAGYFTDIIERSSDKESVKLYYKKYESTTGYEYKKSESGGIWSYKVFPSEYSEGEFTELTGSIEDFLATVAENPGTYTYKNTNDYYLYKRKEIWYQIGILVNRDVLTQALPGIENAGSNNLGFIKVCTFQAPSKKVDE